jgi:hypothetical protein
MSRNFLKAAVYLGIFLMFTLIHFFVMNFIFKSQADFMPVYVFTGIVCGISLIIITEANEYFQKYLAFIFVGIIALKLIAAKIFMDKFDLIEENEYKFSFLTLYLISIVLITIFAARLLLRPEK